MLNAFNNDLFVCGVDEAGRGCLAGPVTAAAVILPKNYTVSYTHLTLPEKVRGGVGGGRGV